MGLCGSDAAAEALAPLCAQLTRGLGTAKATAKPTLPAALQALSSIGRLLPNVFAPHAEAVCTFVMQVCPLMCTQCQVMLGYAALLLVHLSITHSIKCFLSVLLFTGSVSAGLFCCPVLLQHAW